MIRTTDLIAKFRQALEEKWGYIWGTSGEQWTAAKQAELEKTTDDDRAQGRKYGSKWIGHTVADCSGLFTWAFRKLGGTMYHGSDTMYRKYCTQKGELKKGKRADGAALKPGTAVFVWNGKKYSHVGLFIGNGIVIEAMGTINGVTTTKVSASKWTHWGELTGVDYSGNNGTAHSVPSGTDGLSRPFPTLRRGDKGQAVKEMQSLLDRLGYDLGSYGVDGDFGKDTEAAVKRFQRDHGLAADGICGPETWANLLRLPVAEISQEVRSSDTSELPGGESRRLSLRIGTEEETYSVIISGLDLTQARALMNNYPGSVIKQN